MLMPVDRPKLWFLLGALAFLGLFAMHGLNGHGITHVGGSAGHHHEAAVAQGDHDPAAHDPAASASRACDGTCAAVSDAASSVPKRGVIDMTMALCLAVLALAGMLAAHAANQLTPSTVGPAGRLLRITVARPRRDHDPPSIFRLSVQRC